MKVYKLNLQKDSSTAGAWGVQVSPVAVLGVGWSSPCLPRAHKGKKTNSLLLCLAW